MSIKLDWEVESEGGWNEIGEDEAARLARLRQARRARTTLGVILVLALLIGGGVGIKLYTADQQLRADLRATVGTETSAIRIGDSDAYLAIQESVGSWRQMQADRFNAYQAEKAHIQTDGQIVSLDVDGGKGRAVVREMVDGKAYNVVWFYQHEDDGWKHVPPEVAYWGYARELDSPHYAISYWDEDADFVRRLQERLETWWDNACRLTGCHDGSASAPGQMKIRIEPDPLLQIGWAGYDPNTLRVPSPLLGRVPADGSIDPALDRQLAGYVAQQWERQVLGDPPADHSDLAWAHDEFRRWLVAAFSTGAPPAPLFGPLGDQAGGQALLALIERVKQGQDVPQAIQDVTGKSAADLQVDWGLYLTYRLRAETAMVANNHLQEAVLLYMDSERLGGANAPAPQSLTLNAAPSTISVASTRQVGDLLWAEVHFKSATAAFQSGAVDINTVMIEEPFRLYNGRWVHTIGLPGDFGGDKTETGTHVRLMYKAIDTAAMDGLLPQLEQQYLTIASDLGDADPPPLEVHITTDIGGPGFAFSPPSGYPQESPDGIAIWLGSPYTTTYPDNQPIQTTLVNILTRDIASNLVDFETRPASANNSLGDAIARWEVNHLGIAPAGMSGDPIRPGATPAETLDALWTQSQDYSTNGEKAVAADALIQLVVEKKGPGAIPALIKGLPSASGIDAWLNQSVGLHAADLETEWALRVKAAMPGAGVP